MLEWLVRLFNISFDMWGVPMDWRGACIVRLYKAKGDKCECCNGVEQCGFRQGRGCMNQVFAVRQVCEKHLANGKDVFWAFMDLEKAYDTIDRHGMWQMLRVYGV